MPLTKDLRAFIIEWNNTFPLDREYRKKHNLAFNSTAHRETSQVDIYLEWLEENVWSEYEDDMRDQIRKEELYKKGEWISEIKLTVDDEERLYDMIDINEI